MRGLQSELHGIHEDLSMREEVEVSLTHHISSPCFELALSRRCDANWASNWQGEDLYYLTALQVVCTSKNLVLAAVHWLYEDVN